MDLFTEYWGEAITGILAVAFGVWARVVKLAGDSISSQVDKSLDRLGDRLHESDKTLVAFMTSTERRLSRLEAQHERSLEVIQEVRNHFHRGGNKWPTKGE